MLRMASRIATGSITSSWDHQWDAMRAEGCRAEGRRISTAVSGSTAIIADNVAEYVHDKLSYELENCVVPLDSCFVEWKAQEAIGMGLPGDVMEGVFFESVTESNKTVRQILSTDPSAAEKRKNSVEMWMAYPFIFSSAKQYCPTWPGVYVLVFIMDGSRDWSAVTACITNNRPQHAWLKTETGAAEQFHPVAVAMTAFAFMNCKNVVRRDVTAEVGPPAKWLRRQKAPEIRYHVLDINPMKEVLRTEGNIEANGIKKALHICRSHFAHYPNGLFGRGEACTVYRESHVRGSVEHGIVDKDYRIKLG